MVMVDSCSHMAEVHDRMPVILKPHQWEQWTDTEPAKHSSSCKLGVTIST
jgi:putative SOS response-associated peptidase YedK